MLETISTKIMAMIISLVVTAAGAVGWLFHKDHMAQPIVANAQASSVNSQRIDVQGQIHTTDRRIWQVQADLRANLGSRAILSTAQNPDSPEVQAYKGQLEAEQTTLKSELDQLNQKLYRLQERQELLK